MSHPYYHALSSVKKYGGLPEQYVATHSWFDQFKAVIPEVKHRLLLHHDAGIELMLAVFPEDIYVETVNEVTAIERRLIGQQHVEEDFGKMLTLEEVLQCFPDLLPRANDVHLELLARRHNVPEQAFQLIDNVFTTYRRFRNGKRDADALLMNAYGCFIVEQALGLTIAVNNDRRLPTRYLAEKYLQVAWNGRIPTAQACFEEVQVKRWMSDAIVLSKEFNKE